MESKKIPPNITDIITHRFELTEYKQAISTAWNKKKNKAVKVIFDYRN